MTTESLERARAAAAANRSRPETVYTCRVGDPRHRIAMLIPVRSIRCPHGRMIREP